MERYGPRELALKFILLILNLAFPGSQNPWDKPKVSTITSTHLNGPLFVYRRFQIMQQQPPPRQRIVPPNAQTPVAPAVGGFPRSNTVSDGSAMFAPGVGHLRPATLGYLSLT